MRNVYAFGEYLYFIDNRGDGSDHGMLLRLRRDANPGDVPEFLAVFPSEGGTRAGRDGTSW
jgi:hypothetical protein